MEERGRSRPACCQKSTPTRRLSYSSYVQEWPEHDACLEVFQRLVDLAKGVGPRQQWFESEQAGLNEPAGAWEIAIGIGVAAPGAAELLAVVEEARVELQELTVPRVADDDGDAPARPHGAKRLHHHGGPARDFDRQVERPARRLLHGGHRIVRPDENDMPSPETAATVELLRVDIDGHDRMAAADARAGDGAAANAADTEDGHALPRSRRGGVPRTAPSPVGTGQPSRAASRSGNLTAAA